MLKKHSKLLLAAFLAGILVAALLYVADLKKEQKSPITKKSTLSSQDNPEITKTSKSIKSIAEQVGKEVTMEGHVIKADSGTFYLVSRKDSSSPGIALQTTNKSIDFNKLNGLVNVTGKVLLVKNTSYAIDVTSVR